ncbi:glycosyltransferase family 4 protein [Pontiella sulfatireligans]|uniref:Glycosyl transferase family 1 domain-containing protein n=1 Tax=Pontiella sulfatireligans TaxID=2750658 RepID=A0A6C2UQX8_9BACT|nr:glycosyltransferase family 4 protein [Pontiella sulfatireligans]VGO21677.1 hypothetical protein SCARR_03751 [Pontiella sulfatireligans]
MRVLFLFGVFAKVGGIEEFTVDLALGLVRAGVEVEILCSSLHNPALGLLKKAGVKISRIPVVHGCNWNIPDYVLFPFALSRARKADVVIHQKIFDKLFYKNLPRSVRHVFITAYRPREISPELDSRCRFYSFFDLVITQEETFREDIIESGAKVLIEVVPYIPLGIIPLQERAQDTVLRIGMMGRLEPQKNPLMALEIVSLLRNGPPAGWSSVEFNIYGSGTLEAAMRNEAEPKELNVNFHGTYKRSDVPNIVAANNLFIITSHSEGQCIVALEVLASGRPLFATPVGALPQILSEPERGALLNVEDIESAGETIRCWLQNNQSVSAAGIQRSYLNSYNREAIIERYLNVLSTVAE